MSRKTAKARWGSQPNRERSKRPSASEKAYVRLVTAAREAGVKAGRRPRCGVHSIPASYTEDERAYWLDGFRSVRNRPA